MQYNKKNQNNHCEKIFIIFFANACKKLNFVYIGDYFEIYNIIDMKRNDFHIVKFYTVSIAISILLFCSCKSHKPQTIFSERECKMSRAELAEIITNILTINNFKITWSDSTMISGISDSDLNFRFNPLATHNTTVEKYQIRWDFVISNLENNPNKFKVVSTCYRTNNSFNANISIDNPRLNYRENTFYVGRNYHRGRGGAVFYYTVIDALRHICEMEVEHYIDRYGRALRYDIKKDRFYLLQ